MINVVAILNVKDLEAFNEFESQAIPILEAHGGVLISAFEADSTGMLETVMIEVHCIQFPSTDNFDSYRADPVLQELADLRSTAIESTQVYISHKFKNYSRNDT